MWESALWRALCARISERNLSAFIYRMLHEDLSSIIGTETVCSSY